jgi:hypothetical protein
VKGKLSWYQPVGRCHWIAFFSCAVGAVVYPHLRWDIVTGDLHTVAVGYDAAGDAAVVMDILLFDRISAEESLRLARREVDGIAPSDMDECFKIFVDYLSLARDAYVTPNPQSRHRLRQWVAALATDPRSGLPSQQVPVGSATAPSDLASDAAIAGGQA